MLLTMRRASSVTAILCAAMLACTAISRRAEAAKPPPGLLLPAQGNSSETTDTGDPDVVRQREVRINYDALPSHDAAAPVSLRMKFFRDLEVEVVLETVIVRTPQSYTWHGHVMNEPDALVQLTIEGNIVLGEVRSPMEGFCELGYIADDVHIAREIDGRHGPDFGTLPTDDIRVDFLGGTRTTRAARDTGYDTGDVLDVLIAYTPEARDLAGGVEAIEALMNAMIDQANQHYANSSINPRIRLVRQAMVDYAETGMAGMGQDLNRFRVDGDGYMDDVHDWRETYGADLMCLLRSRGNFCGLAYQMTTLSHDFEQWAYSTTTTTCATRYMAFSHEVAHNYGCSHDRAHSGGSTLFPYSYGYRFIAPSDGVERRTVMAVLPGGWLIPHFSNPDVTWDSMPTGVPVGEPEEAHNALSINNAAFTVANWRPAVDQLQISVGGLYFSIGPEGGPFSPPTKTYALTNLDVDSLGWSMSSDATWLDFSPSSGTLNGLTSTIVTASINSNADALDEGVYNATVSVTNTTSGSIRFLDATLAVTGPPPSPPNYTFHWFDMDQDPGWSTQGEWAFGVPLGDGSFNRDPSSGYTGPAVYGFNLSGDYDNDLPETSLATTALDCTGMENIHLEFRRWLGVDDAANDQAKVQVSVNGTDWIHVWAHNAGAISDTTWSRKRFDISGIADNQPTVFVRWVMGATDGTVTYPGWNIDDVAITGLPIPEHQVWVDFAHTGVEEGTEANPYNTVEEAVDAVPAGGTIKISGDSSVTSSAETPTLSKPLEIRALHGPIRIGSI